MANIANNENGLMGSYYRCRRSGVFLDTFYDTFLSKSEAVRKMFSKTEFKWQKIMLQQSLLDMVAFYQGLEGTDEEIERLGQMHKEMDVQPEMYEMWLDSLCHAIRVHDPLCSADLESEWREAMSVSIRRIIVAGGGE